MRGSDVLLTTRDVKMHVKQKNVKHIMAPQRGPILIAQTGDSVTLHVKRTLQLWLRSGC